MKTPEKTTALDRLIDVLAKQMVQEFLDLTPAQRQAAIKEEDSGNCGSTPETRLKSPTPPRHKHSSRTITVRFKPAAEPGSE